MENGKRRTENGERKAENGERRTENGERRTESGERKAENGKRKYINPIKPINPINPINSPPTIQPFNLYKKNILAPMTLMTAPSTSRAVTFWWKSRADGAMMSTGVSAKSVWAMPVEV